MRVAGSGEKGYTSRQEEVPMNADEKPEAAPAPVPEDDPFAYKKNRPPIPSELAYHPQPLSERKANTMRKY